MKHHATIALFLLFAAANPCAAQDAATKELRLPAGEHKLTALVETFATYLGQNILFSEADLTGNPNSTIRTMRELVATPDSALGLFSSLLYSKSFALVRLNAKHGIWEVVNMQGSRRGEIATHAIAIDVKDLGKYADSKLLIQTTLQLEHVRANVATTTLRPFFTMSGVMSPLTIGNVGNDDTILLMGFADTVAAAVRMIRASDVPPKAPKAGSKLADRLERIEARLKFLEGKKSDK